MILLILHGLAGKPSCNTLSCGSWTCLETADLDYSHVRWTTQAQWDKEKQKQQPQGNSLTHFKTFSDDLFSFKGQTDQHLIHHGKKLRQQKKVSQLDL